MVACLRDNEFMYSSCIWRRPSFACRSCALLRRVQPKDSACGTVPRLPESPPPAGGQTSGTGRTSLWVAPYLRRQGHRTCLATAAWWLSWVRGRCVTESSHFCGPSEGQIPAHGLVLRPSDPWPGPSQTGFHGWDPLSIACPVLGSAYPLGSPGLLDTGHSSLPFTTKVSLPFPPFP